MFAHKANHEFQNLTAPNLQDVDPQEKSVRASGATQRVVWLCCASTTLERLACSPLSCDLYTGLWRLVAPMGLVRSCPPLGLCWGLGRTLSRFAAQWLVTMAIPCCFYVCRLTADTRSVGFSWHHSPTLSAQSYGIPAGVSRNETNFENPSFVVYEPVGVLHLQRGCACRCGDRELLAALKALLGPNFQKENRGRLFVCVPVGVALCFANRRMLPHVLPWCHVQLPLLHGVAARAAIAHAAKPAVGSWGQLPEFLLLLFLLLYPLLWVYYPRTGVGVSCVCWCCGFWQAVSRKCWIQIAIPLREALPMDL